MNNYHNVSLTVVTKRNAALALRTPGPEYNVVVVKIKRTAPNIMRK
jgi:hypothetical protein